MPPRTKKKTASKKKLAAKKTHRRFDDHNPSHYHTNMGGPLAGTEAVDVIEAYFARDAHLSQAVKYLCRAGKKPDSSYTKDVGKAAWWLVRALIFHGGLTDLQGVIELLRRKGVLKSQGD